MRSLQRRASAFASFPWRIKLRSREMAKPKIAVIISTTRATRFSEKPARWIYDIARARTDVSVELIDLRDYPMPSFDEPATSASAPSKTEVAKRWRRWDCPLTLGGVNRGARSGGGPKLPADRAGRAPISETPLSALRPRPGRGGIHLHRAFRARGARGLQGQRCRPAAAYRAAGC